MVKWGRDGLTIASTLFICTVAVLFFTDRPFIIIIPGPSMLSSSAFKGRSRSGINPHNKPRQASDNQIGNFLLAKIVTLNPENINDRLPFLANWIIKSTKEKHTGMLSSVHAS